MHKLMLAVLAVSGCASIKSTMQDPTRTVVAIRFVDGNALAEGVAVCRVKEDAAEWGCVRWETFQQMMNESQTVDAGVY